MGLRFQNMSKMFLACVLCAVAYSSSPPDVFTETDSIKTESALESFLEAEEASGLRRLPGPAPFNVGCKHPPCKEELLEEASGFNVGCKHPPCKEELLEEASDVDCKVKPCDVDTSSEDLLVEVASDDEDTSDEELADDNNCKIKPCNAELLEVADDVDCKVKPC